MNESNLQGLAISVGNTRTSFGLFDGKTLAESRSIANASVEAVVDAVAKMAEGLKGAERPIVAIATVNPMVSSPLVDRLSSLLDLQMHIIGDDVPPPIEQATDPATRTGADRLLAAAAAFDVVRQACVIIDVGTAITVDFVDGVGVFQGGAIAPGPRLMLRSLHQAAAQLPEVELERPDMSESFGKNTREAMLSGVFFGLRGFVRAIAEHYAEAYGGYPQIIATGGDARYLFEGDDFVEHIVDDLVLRGIAIACQAALADVSADGGEEA